MLAIAVPLCLFADKWFSFSLDYNITRDCSVFFWQYETTSVFENATADVTSHLGENSFAFATLGLSFTGETIISLDLGWTPFYKKNGTGESYALETSVNMEYDLVLDLKGTASQYSWSDSQSESEDGFVNGYQVCFSRKNLVEQGNPITVEEMQHLESCYNAYHADGNNGVGTILYEKIRDHAIIKTGAEYGPARKAKN